jgi:hypothetical protein
MAMKELGIMRVGEVGSNVLRIVVFLLVGRRRMVVFARGRVERRGCGTIF